MNYLVFAGHDYYPYGGWGDLKGKFSSKDEAIEFAKSLKFDWLQVVDPLGDIIATEYDLNRLY